MNYRPICPVCKISLRLSHLNNDTWICSKCNTVYHEEIYKEDIV